MGGHLATLHVHPGPLAGPHRCEIHDRCLGAGSHVFVGAGHIGEEGATTGAIETRRSPVPRETPPGRRRTRACARVQVMAWSCSVTKRAVAWRRTMGSWR